MILHIQAVLIRRLHIMVTTLQIEGKTAVGQMVMLGMKNINDVVIGRITPPRIHGVINAIVVAA